MRNAALLLVVFLMSPAFADDPYRELAEEKYAEGDYNLTRDLCEALVKQNPQDEKAKELLTRSKVQLERLAHEAFVYGSMLESLNRIEEAKQYWNRARRYVRPGDKYYAWTEERLTHYH